MFGVTLWCFCLVLLFGAIVWYYCLVLLFGASVWRYCLALVADCFLVTYSGAGSVWCLVWTGGLQVCSWWCSAAPASPAFPFKVGPSYFSPISLLLILGNKMAWFGVWSSFYGEINLPTNTESQKWGSRGWSYSPNHSAPMQQNGLVWGKSCEC